MSDAAREGRDYGAVTARGAQVHAARQARALYEELRLRVERARETYGLARDEGLGRVSAGLAALRAAAKRDRGRGDAGDRDDKGRDDIRARLGRVLERGAGARERDGAERDAVPSEDAARSRADIRDRLVSALDRARPVGPDAVQEREAKEAREVERERVRDALRARTRGLDWGR